MNENRIQGGYILLSRKIIESEIWDKPPLYLKIWIYLLSKAQFKDYKGLKRGQVFFNIPEIQEACSHYVGFRKEMPTYDQVRNAIEWMKQCSNTDSERFSYEAQHEDQHEDQTNANMITTTKTTRGVIANIVNYNVYQDSKNYEAQYEYQHENRTNTNTKTERIPKGTHTIDKNDKNDKNVKNERMNDIRSTQFDYVIHEWNSLDENISQIQNINSGTTRYKLLKARENEYGKENIIKAIRNINNSSFLKGYEKSWKITFDWFIKPNNFIKVLEDNYTDKKSHNQKPELDEATRAYISRKLKDDEFTPRL